MASRQRALLADGMGLGKTIQILALLEDRRINRGEHLPSLVDYQFTAQMEDFLDSISRGEAQHVEYLRRFYFGGRLYENIF